MEYSPRLLYPWDFPGKNTGVDCHFLLQGIFPTLGLNVSPLSPALAGGLDSLPLSHKGSPIYCIDKIINDKGENKADMILASF